MTDNVRPLRPDLPPPPPIPPAVLAVYQTRIAAMLADPDCKGDLLLLGISLLDYAILGTSTSKHWDHYVARAGLHPGSLHGLLRKDIRRYDGVKDAGPRGRCGAPMIRRPGPCNGSAARQILLADPDTGRKQWLAACNRHASWFETTVRTHRMHADDAAPPVTPAANAGGVLARHIPELHWQKTYRDIDPTWEPPPEDEPTPAPVKPLLRLV